MVGRSLDASKKKEKVGFRGMLLAIIIICIFDNFITTTYVNGQIETICNLLLVIFSILYFVYDFFKEPRINGELFVIILTVFAILVSFYLNSSNFSATSLKIAMFVFSYVYAKKHTIVDFYLPFKKIMTVIIIATLFLNFLFMVGVSLSFLPLLENTKGTMFYWGILGNVHANSTSSFLRLSGIWWEPGVFAAYLVVGLMMELFIPKKIDSKYFLLLIAALALTFSTTGYICFFVVLAAYLLDKRKKGVMTKIFIAVLLIAALFLIASNDALNEMVFSKLEGDNESFNDRYHSVVGNIIGIKENPLLGVGTIRSAEIMQSYLRSQGLTRSFNNLNTLLAYFSVFGLIPGLLFNIKVFKFSFGVGNSFLSKTVLYVMFVLMLSSTNYSFSLFFTVLFFLKRGKSNVNNN